MRLHRVVVDWAGPQVTGKAVTVLHFDATEAAAPPVAAVKSAFTALAPAIPTGVTMSVPNSGDTIEDTTGHLTGVWTATGAGTVNGSGAAACAAGVGACVSWSTGAIVSGTKGPRHLRGRTFMVPLTSTAYDTDGTITAPAMSTLGAFANALVTAGGLGIWHRPTTVGGSDGGSGAVLSGRVRDKVAYLSSRRD